MFRLLHGQWQPALALLNPQVAGMNTYDFEGRLIVRTKPDGSTINLSYDADRRGSPSPRPKCLVAPTTLSARPLARVSSRSMVAGRQNRFHSPAAL